MNNPMQLLQMFTQIKNATNPMQFMSNMFGNNSQFNMAMKMAEGKSPEEMQNVINNICKQKGIDINQVKQMAEQFGIKI